MKGSKRSGDAKDAFRYWWKTAEASCREIFPDIEASRLYGVFRAGWMAHRHEVRHGSQEPSGLAGHECIAGPRHDWENTTTAIGRFHTTQAVRVCRLCHRIETLPKPKTELTVERNSEP